MLKAVLFDMDGTLLPMDQEYFVKNYLKLLAKRSMDIGYDPKDLVEAMWKCTYRVIRNDGTRMNRDVFWEEFGKIFGKEKRADEAFFDAFYKNEFKVCKQFAGYNPKAAETVFKLKNKGYRVALATNPVFSTAGARERFSWTGIDPDEMEYITTYDNSRFCKPHPEYYLDVCRYLNVRPEECIMIGNDPMDDMPARNVGMDVFLLTDNLENADGVDISVYPQGSFDELCEYLNI